MNKSTDNQNDNKPTNHVNDNFIIGICTCIGVLVFLMLIGWYYTGNSTKTPAISNTHNINQNNIAKILQQNKISPEMRLLLSNID